MPATSMPTAIWKSSTRICTLQTLEENASLVMEINIARGRGYVAGGSE
jgi:DNA-directed RNA polymerase alpha subunit